MAEGGEAGLPDADALFEDAACGLLLTARTARSGASTGRSAA
jgi:hypothetical protein